MSSNPSAAALPACLALLVCAALLSACGRGDGAPAGPGGGGPPPAPVAVQPVVTADVPVGSVVMPGQSIAKITAGPMVSRKRATLSRRTST